MCLRIENPFIDVVCDTSGARDLPSLATFGAKQKRKKNSTLKTKKISLLSYRALHRNFSEREEETKKKDKKITRVHCNPNRCHHCANLTHHEIHSLTHAYLREKKTYRCTCMGGRRRRQVSFSFLFAYEIIVNPLPACVR